MYVKYFLHVRNIVRIKDLNIVKVYLVLIDGSNNCLRYRLVVGFTLEVGIQQVCNAITFWGKFVEVKDNSHDVKNVSAFIVT